MSEPSESHRPGDEHEPGVDETPTDPGARPPDPYGIPPAGVAPYGAPAGGAPIGGMPPGVPPMAPVSAPRRVSKWASIAPGTPYHLLARNSAHRWWRPLVSLLLFVVLAVSAILLAGFVQTLFLLLSAPWKILRAATAGPVPPTPQAVPLLDPLIMLLLSFGVLAALIPAVLFTARWTQRRPFGSVAGVTGTLRWNWLGECLLWGVAVFGSMFAISTLLSALSGLPPPDFPGWRTYVAIAAVALLVVPLQSAAEEFVFRGLLLQTLTAWFRIPWIGMVLTSVLFLSGHGYTDPLVWAELLLMAMTMCWLSIRTGGLEAAIALHVANNSLSLLIAGVAGVPGLQQAGDYTLAQVLPFIVAILVFAWLVDRRARRRQMETVVGGRVPIGPLSLQPRYGVAGDRQTGEAVS